MHSIRCWRFYLHLASVGQQSRLLNGSISGISDVGIFGMKTRERKIRGQVDSIKEGTIAALNRVVEPLLELMLDAGVTVHEFNQLVRERAVRVAMKRLMKAGSKESKSRAAIMTGLPRSEVTRILKSSDAKSTSKSNQLPARRILAAWNDDPRFTTTNGNPAVLPIFGRTPCFEELVERYGGGMPVRAMLDELTQMQAVERLPNQQVKVHVRVPILTGLTAQSIAAVGERSCDLLRTLAHNRRQPSQPLFEATAVSDSSDRDMIAFVRREISAQGMDFINNATSLLNRSEPKADKISAAGSRCRVGVSVFYFEDEVDAGGKIATGDGQSRRKNLRRNMGKKLPT